MNTWPRRMVIAGKPHKVKYPDQVIDERFVGQYSGKHRRLLVCREREGIPVIAEDIFDTLLHEMTHAIIEEYAALGEPITSSNMDNETWITEWATVWADVLVRNGIVSLPRGQPK